MHLVRRLPGLPCSPAGALSCAHSPAPSLHARCRWPAWPTSASLSVPPWPRCAAADGSVLWEVRVHGMWYQ